MKSRQMLDIKQNKLEEKTYSQVNNAQQKPTKKSNLFQAKETYSVINNKSLDFFFHFD